MKSSIEIAASFIKKADAIIIGAGAGIGCDSGLPDFRGNEGFWKNYPPYRGLFDFYDCANPAFLQRQPNLFWGFYGSRLQMYRKTIPHKGFNMMLDYSRILGKEIFVITSNVDGQFQKAGYPQEKVYEVHGSIHYLQCDECLVLQPNDFQPEINYHTMSCSTLPYCASCNSPMRPNVLMFNDYDWIDDRTTAQQIRYKSFLKSIKQTNKSVCLIEIGAGTAVPTIRNMLEREYYHDKKAMYVRINPDREDNSMCDAGRFVHLEMGCLEGVGKVQEGLG